ncbi:hypothetical protein MNBD_GAMMA12-1490 [hydrothermal vent metagenome]|uniref:Spermidine synthase n=1 Tax=hydrothermal vent metagenome TaxID=652676 RepID=A0A3B0YCA4_9ZZZZ
MIIDQLYNPQLLAQRGKIKVFENNLFRWLCFEDEKIIQSCMLKEDPAKLNLPYQPFMMMWQLFFNRQPSSACLLGLGGGDMARYLGQQFPLVKLLVVEQDPDVAKLASEFFLLNPDQNKLTVEIADAKKFIQKKQQFDLIFIDIVIDNKPPDFLYTEDFWYNCHHKLASDGVMIFNMVTFSDKEFLTLLEILRKEFGRLPFCMSVTDHKNIVMLMPLDTNNQPTLAELKQRSILLQKKMNYRIKCVWR